MVPAASATPVIWQLAALLPPEGSEFPAWKRRQWLVAVAAVLDFVYAGSEEDAVLAQGGTRP